MYFYFYFLYEIFKRVRVFLNIEILFTLNENSFFHTVDKNYTFYARSRLQMFLIHLNDISKISTT